jgi:argininosuccinate lyase
MAGIISTLTVKREAMARRALEGYSTVTELADEIVRRSDLSFRQSHHIVGLVTRMAIEAGKQANEITSEMVDTAARETIGKPLGLDEHTVKRALDPVENVRVRDIVGGPAPEEVRRMIEAGKDILVEDKHRLEQRKRKLEEGADRLRSAVEAVANN